MEWCVDVPFGAHNNTHSHSGSVFTLRIGAICYDSTKQRMNARSSREAKLISIDDKVSKMILMNY